MATVVMKRVRKLGPDTAGARMTPRAFDRAIFVEGWRYELINGVLVLSTIPLPSERDPNGELEYRLRLYRDTNPQGGSLDATLSEQTVRTKQNRRRADRVIWAGRGRLPKSSDPATIIAEFVSAGKRDRQRDYEEKRDEYLEMGVREYWIIDRFLRTMTIFSHKGAKVHKRVIQEKQVYTTDLLPGFELPLADLLAAADRWPE